MIYSINQRFTLKEIALIYLFVPTLIINTQKQLQKNELEQ